MFPLSPSRVSACILLAAALVPLRGPDVAAQEKKSSLVVALHVLGGSTGQFIRARGLTDQAEKYGFVVAAPVG